MNFRTEIKHPELKQKLSPSSSTLLIGSCFTENIGQKLKEQLIPCSTNPFGILYNPLSIQKSLNKIIDKDFYTEDDLIRSHNEYCSLDHHGSFNSPSKSQTLKDINHSIDLAHSFLKESEALIISLGTSYVYRLKSNGEIVGNCHRLAANSFKRELVLFPELLTHYHELFTKLKGFNPELKIILTVSPVRHLRDSFNENQVSKAQLLTLSYLLQESFENCHYFPSYEIMMDDLRDYRFYEDDMIHPSQAAIEYIWEQFQSFAYDAKSQQYFHEIRKLKKRLAHRLRNPQDPQSIEYQKQSHELLSQLKKKYPNADWNSLN